MVKLDGSLLKLYGRSFKLNCSLIATEHSYRQASLTAVIGRGVSFQVAVRPALAELKDDHQSHYSNLGISLIFVAYQLKPMIDISSLISVE